MSTEDRRQQPDEDARDVDGGAYIGNRPELAEETIPGGLQDEDERVAGHDSRSSGSGVPMRRRHTVNSTSVKYTSTPPEPCRTPAAACPGMLAKYQIYQINAPTG